MSLVTTKEIAHSDITAQCESCHQTYLIKYWDEELDWYIEVNEKNFCRYCEPEQTQ